MKLVVAGSRTIEDYNFVEAYIENCLKRFPDYPTQLFSGVARGVDRLAEEWAQKNNIPIVRYFADWKKHGKAAGPIRNAAMAEDADAGIILNESHSRGASDMASQLLKRGKPCYVVHFLDYEEVGRQFNGYDCGQKKTLVEYKAPENSIWKDWNARRNAL